MAVFLIKTTRRRKFFLLYFVFNVDSGVPDQAKGNRDIECKLKCVKKGVEYKANKALRRDFLISAKVRIQFVGSLWVYLKGVRG